MTSTSPIGTVTWGQQTQSTSGTSPTSSTATTPKDKNTVDTDMFLKLLVAQMKNQDPNSSSDPQQFLGESAQFAMVERLSSLEKLTTSLESLSQKAYLGSQQQTAAALVGQTVTYADSAATTKTGVVTGVGFGSSTPTLTIDGVAVPLDKITTVGTAATSALKTTTDEASTTA